MKKSELTEIIKEVIRETIRRVDGKYVVYPEKGGKRLGTHSSKAAAEKQLTAIHLNKEITDTDTKLTVLSVIDGKRNLDNDQIRQLFDDSTAGTFYIYTNEEGEYENTKPVSRQDAYKYIDYYNARLKKDYSKEEKLGAELGVLGIESELQFKQGEFRTDPSVFSANENYTATSPEQKINDLPKGKIFDDAKNIEGIFKKSNHSWSEVIEAFEKNRYKDKQENINLNDISITQPNIQSKKVNHIIKNINKYPTIDVVEFPDGEKVIYDGHHRLVASWALGDTKIKANLIQVDELEENYADGKVKEAFSPSPLQNLVNDYLFFITMNFTHLEKTGKSPQDVDALTQMIRQAKVDVDKLKDLSKDQLEKNKNSILQRIHDMLTYIISRMKAHMRPEEYEKRRDRLNRLLALYKDAAKVQENYADGEVKGKSRPGRVKKSGASCKGSVADLRAKAKKYGGEKGKMYHWCANMKGGK